MSYLRVQYNNPTNVSDTKKILKSTSVSRTTRRKSKPSWMTHKPVEQKFTARSSAHVKHNAGLNYRPPRHVGGFAPAGATAAEVKTAEDYSKETGEMHAAWPLLSKKLQGQIKQVIKEGEDKTKTAAMDAIRKGWENETEVQKSGRQLFIASTEREEAIRAAPKVSEDTRKGRELVDKQTESLKRNKKSSKKVDPKDKSEGGSEAKVP